MTAMVAHKPLEFFMKKLYIFLFIWCFLNCVIAQTEAPALNPMVMGAGKSMDRETAFRLACQEALYSRLAILLSRDLFQKHQTEIQRYLAKHYQKYFVAEPNIEYWDGWEMKVQGRADLEKMLNEIQRYLVIPDLEQRVAIFQWDDARIQITASYASPEQLKLIAQAQLENILRNYGLSFTTPQQIQQTMTREMLESGTLATGESTAFVENHQSHFLIHAGLVVQRCMKPYATTVLQYGQVQMSVEIYLGHDQTKIFSKVFPPDDAVYGTRLIPHEAMSQQIYEQLVSKVSRMAGQEIANCMRTFHPYPKTRYMVYFAGFSNSQKLLILKAFDQMLARQQLEDVQRSISGGDALKMIVQSQKKMSALQDMIVTHCSDQGILIVLDPSRQDELDQSFYYTPAE